jgi:hypothetical protein
MTIKKSEARRKYWASLTAEQRSLLLSQRRKKGWRKKSKPERLAIGRKLTDIRLSKQKQKLSTV